jgi:hypothetical protein
MVTPVRKRGRISSGLVWAAGTFVLVSALAFVVRATRKEVSAVGRSELRLRAEPSVEAAGPAGERPGPLAHVDEPPDLMPPAPAPSYKPRPPGEWQGMLVDLAVSPPCLEGFCGMARACVNGACTACNRDDECLTGEVCVLDHCLHADHVRCRSSRECRGDEVCMLSGYSHDGRANADMQSYCLDPRQIGVKPRLPARPSDPPPGVGGRDGGGRHRPRTPAEDELRRAREIIGL